MEFFLLIFKGTASWKKKLVLPLEPILLVRFDTVGENW
jgi:hypothetical protein